MRVFMVSCQAWGLIRGWNESPWAEHGGNPPRQGGEFPVHTRPQMQKAITQEQRQAPRATARGQRRRDTAGGYQATLCDRPRR